MIRRSALVAAGAALWIVLQAGPAAAQGAGAEVPDAGGVVVDVADLVRSGPEQGVLSRSDSSSPTRLSAVYVSLTVLGTTLAFISWRRRAAHRRMVELATGVRSSRHASTEFWGLPPAPRLPAYPGWRVRRGADMAGTVPRVATLDDTGPHPESRPAVRTG